MYVCVTSSLRLRNVLRARQNTGLPKQLVKAVETDVESVIRRRGETKLKDKKTVGQVELNIWDCKRK